MTNEQIAHDLAVARMAGKQLPTKELVEEYKSAYKAFLEYLDSVPTEPAKIEPFKRTF